MSRPAIVHHVRTVEPVSGIDEAADRIRALAEGWPVALSPLQTAAIPGLGVCAVVAVRMLDPRGPTELCTVALGEHERTDLVAALARAYSPRRAA